MENLILKKATEKCFPKCSKKNLSRENQHLTRIEGNESKMDGDVKRQNHHHHHYNWLSLWIMNERKQQRTKPSLRF
ncbi:hypothetical protein DERP_003093 [Dermatophagoides pteronyssinus]|uniref:Uncharacterized protein n=1 Tax=Dermatophagoides pteronyssinus TaxID=6956 RepID=A0ABQ8JIU8_DERPT|nr:hypothetical protein DERP_003093 [Dermatophagoides pteronyssinus]